MTDFHSTGSGGVVHDDGHAELVEHLEVGVERLVVEVELAVVAGELHADDAELLHAALELVDALLVAPRRHARGREEPSARAGDDVGGVVVDGLARLERQPLLPDGTRMIP